MEIKVDLNFDILLSLLSMSKSRAVRTLEAIKEADAEDDLMHFLESEFRGGLPKLSTINNLLWHDAGYVFECLGIDDICNEKASEH